MSDNDIILTYQGELFEQTISDLLDFAEHRMIEGEVERKVRKKVYMILMESLQNSFNHGEHEGKKRSTVALIQLGDSYELTIGNYLNNVNRKPLEEKLKLIDTLDDEGIKLKYREVLNNGERSDKGGSGLGLLHIARRAGSNMSYSIEEISDQLSYLTLNIKIE